MTEIRINIALNESGSHLRNCLTRCNCGSSLYFVKRYPLMFSCINFQLFLMQGIVSLIASRTLTS